MPKKQKAAVKQAHIDMIATAEDQLAAAMPENENKPLEYGYDNAHDPAVGATVEVSNDAATGSTLTEGNSSNKTGPRAPMGHNAMDGSIAR